MSVGRGQAPLVTVGFGGGCHWCTEAVFDALEGVTSVRQGFIAAAAPDDALSEAALVTFDPARIPLAVLVEIHLRTHSSTSDHTMRGKYRSAVYVRPGDPAAEKDAGDALALAAASLEAPIVTRVLPLVRFEESPVTFRRYYARNAGKPFCVSYIDPKLRLLRERYAGHLRPLQSDVAPAAEQRA